jgi:phage terminase small subunit
MPGPPKKPIELKLLQGTKRSDEQPPEFVVDPIEWTPEPPDWLPNAHAVNKWKAEVPRLVACRLLAELDLDTLGHLCALHGKMVQLWAAGEAPTGHMLAQFNSLASAFGMAPAWRGKVKPAGQKAKSKFDKFKKPVE